MTIRLRRTHTLVLTAIAVSIVAVYGPLVRAGQINWDDDANIFGNPYYSSGDWKPFWEGAYFGLYVPVTSMVWQAAYLVGGGSAVPFRVLNLALHLVNSVLAFVLLKALAERWRLQSVWALIAATALFALHPMQVQAVAWISGGRDLLAAFFAMAGLAVFFRGSGRAGVAASSLLYALAVLCKPSVAMLPVLLPLLSCLVDRTRLGHSVIAAVLWGTVTVGSTYMTAHAQRDFLLSLTWWERLMIMGDTYSFYLQKLICPYPLAANYDRIPEVILATAQPYWRAPALALIVAGCCRFAYRFDRRFAIALAWVGLLLPVSGLVPFGYQRISTTADHYHYLPMLTIGAVVVLGLNRWPTWCVSRPFVILPFVALLGGSSLWRVQVWTDDRAFFDDMIRSAPESYSTGLGMSAVECGRNRNYAEGERWSHVALARRPNDMMALANLAHCRFKSRDITRAVQLEAYLDKVDLDEMAAKQPSALSSFLASVGSALIEDGRLHDGYQLLCHAYQIKPSEPMNVRNVIVGTAILENAGIIPTCERVLRSGKKSGG